MSELMSQIFHQEIEQIHSDAKEEFGKVVEMDPFGDFSGARRLFGRMERALRPLLHRLATHGFADAHLALETQLSKVSAFAEIGDLDEDDDDSECGEVKEQIADQWNAAEDALYGLGPAVLPTLKKPSARIDTPADLNKAYEQTQYMVDPSGDGSVLLEIRAGQRNADLELLLEDQGLAIAPWTLITAFNPRSQQRSEQENAAANERLRKRLRAEGLAAWNAWGEAPGWGREMSFFVPGLEFERAVWLAREFEQIAVLHQAEDDVPEVLTCGPLPLPS